MTESLILELGSNNTLTGVDFWLAEQGITMF